VALVKDALFQIMRWKSHTDVYLCSSPYRAGCVLCRRNVKAQLSRQTASHQPRVQQGAEQPNGLFGIFQRETRYSRHGELIWNFTWLQFDVLGQWVFQF